MRKLLAVNLFFIGNVSADLVGHWLFNEGNGTIYADSSKNKNPRKKSGGRGRFNPLYIYIGSLL